MLLRRTASGETCGDLTLEARMPLHVDRTTVQPHLHHHVGGHVLDRPASRPTTDAASQTGTATEETAVLRLAAPAPPANDVTSVNEAEKLVQTLIASGGRSVLAAHGSFDPSRAAALLRG
jgi:hypothetical protein